MGIREARVSDWRAIKELLNQLDYFNTDLFLPDRINLLLKNPDAKLLVYVHAEKVIACISVHFIPQLALQGEFARMSYFVVDKDFRGQGVGSEIEEYVGHLARERNCDRIEVHCHSRRLDAHRFYSRQGFIEVPKYFVKLLHY